jgi:hypothetical protein
MQELEVKDSGLWVGSTTATSSAIVSSSPFPLSHLQKYGAPYILKNVYAKTQRTKR